jgi:ribosome-binding factor A
MAPKWNVFIAKLASAVRRPGRAGEAREIVLVMEFQRSDRVGDLLLELLAELLKREIRDPRLQSVNLTAVRVTKDLRQAKVFFNLFGGGDKNEALSGLKSATGFIRSKISKQLSLRFVPSVEFAFDETEEDAQRIESLLRSVKP